MSNGRQKKVLGLTELGRSDHAYSATLLCRQMQPPAAVVQTAAKQNFFIHVHGCRRPVIDLGERFTFIKRHFPGQLNQESYSERSVHHKIGVAFHVPDPVSVVMNPVAVKSKSGVAEQ